MALLRKAIPSCSCALAIALALGCISCGDCVERPVVPQSSRQNVRGTNRMTFTHAGIFSSLADQGLQKLIEGNQRFTRGEARFPTVCKETLADLAKGQQLFATILGCSDSRVPPELIFDANFGELFIVRVAGNVISPEVMGSLQYAGAHLRTPLFVVLGREGCGAVKAALDQKVVGREHLSRIQTLVDSILPRLPETSSQLSDREQLATAVEANVR
jgi:carbonic anhydrase